MPNKDLFEKWISFQNQNTIPALIINGETRNNFNPYHSAKLWPISIINCFEKHALTNAKLKCQLNNLGEKKTTLNHQQLNGICPRFLEFKFKKFYNNPNETSTKAALLDLAIKQELDQINAKTLELQNILENQYSTLKNELLPIISNTDYLISTDQLKNLLDYSTQYLLSGFILKQQADKTIKAEKRKKFLEQKEIQEEDITIKRKDVLTLNKQIKKLQQDIKQLQLNQREGKAKGKSRKAAGNPSKTTKRSTKTTRKRNGSKSNTANIKK